MHFFRTKDKPPVYAGIAAVSLMILTGLTFAGMAVVLTVMMPVLLVLIPIIVPAVITLSFVATGFLASGSLGASAITLLVWLYKKEEYSRSNMHARVRSKGDKGGNLSRGDKPPEEARPSERNWTAEKIKSTGRDKGEEYEPLEKEKLSELDTMAEEFKPSEKENFPERYPIPAEEDKSLGGINHAEEGPSIPEISKVLLAEQNPIGSKRCSPDTSSKRSYQLRFGMDPAKVRSTFLKEYQKVPRVGAFAYKYFTSRDKKYINHLHI